MNYAKIYEQLIQRGLARVPDGYVERHHIVPRCIGGSDSKDNLVALYPEEHFLAHILLIKIYPELPQLILAVNRMCQGRSGRKSRKLYGWLRRRFSEYQSSRVEGEGNPSYGTMWICNIELQENKKILKDSPIPAGWIKGRSRWSKTFIRKCKCGMTLQIGTQQRVCAPCKSISKQERIQKFRKTVSNRKVKRSFFTNGIRDLKLKVSDPVPDGYYPGRSLGKQGLQRGNPKKHAL